MKTLSNKFAPLSREEAKTVLGGGRNPADDCPAGTHEYTCALVNGDLSNTVYVKYCVPDGQPNPFCGN